MSTRTNKAIVRRYIDQVWNERRPDLIEEFFIKEFIHHENVPPGIDGFMMYYDLSLTSFPDQRTTINDMIAEGDKVVARTTMRATHQDEPTGIPSRGEKVTQRGVSIFRFAKARIVEVHSVVGPLGLV